MKKFLLTFCCALLSLTAVAQTSTSYTDSLTVTINGSTTPKQEATIIAEKNADGSYNFLLNNFTMEAAPGEFTYVGNIKLNNVEVSESEGISTFTHQETILITAGDDSSKFWIGPMLGNVPINISGKMTAEKLFCTIDIYMEDLKQSILVYFGEDIVAGIDHINGNQTSVSVYGLNGVCLRSNVKQSEALKNLPKGVYIVGGKKVLK